MISSLFGAYPIAYIRILAYYSLYMSQLHFVEYYTNRNDTDRLSKWSKKFNSTAKVRISMLRRTFIAGPSMYYTACVQCRIICRRRRPLMLLLLLQLVVLVCTIRNIYNNAAQHRLHRLSAVHEI